MLDKLESTVALALVKRERKMYAEYEEEVDEWFRTGEGKRRGWAFPRCIHGRSLWVEHDIPCGWCESYGTYFNYVETLRDASARASYIVTEYRKRLSMLHELMEAGAPHGVLEPMREWVTWDLLEALGEREDLC